MDKKAVSLMLSYVILISIVIAMSIAVFAWLKLIANVEPVASCDESTSIIISNSVCDVNSQTLTLTLKNNGRFSVEGFILRVGDNPARTPTTILFPQDKQRITKEGYFSFEEPLKPGESTQAIFTNQANTLTGLDNIDSIKKIRVQSYVMDDESGEKVICENILNQDIKNCQLVA